MAGSGPRSRLPLAGLHSHLGQVALFGVLARLLCPLAAAEDIAPEIGRFDHPPIVESSGIVRSLRHPDVWWTHNDSGSSAVLYATTAAGKLIGQVSLPGAANLDWEDIALDSLGNLWVGDIGDNLRWRSSLTVYRVKEPDPRAAKTARATPFALAYPDGPRDAEGLFAWNKRLFLISKMAPPALTGVYAVEPRQSEKPTVMKRVATLRLSWPITGADLSRDGKRLALAACQGVYVFIGEGEVEQILQQRPHRLELRGKRQVEAVGFDGYDLILTNEQRQLFRVEAEAYEEAPQADAR